MASIHKEIVVQAPPDQVWDAVRDFGAVDERLGPGFITACELDGTTRIVTFANGFTVREPLVEIDDARRRLVYTSEGGRASHYNAAMQVIPEGTDGTRLAWTIDLLPDDLLETVAALQGEALDVIQRTLSARGS